MSAWREPSEWQEREQRNAQFSYPSILHPGIQFATQIFRIGKIERPVKDNQNFGQKKAGELFRSSRQEQFWQTA
jgi:hypothetical protein